MGWVGASVVRLESCNSTNDEAHRLAETGAPHGTLVIADSQTKGRGQRGRKWFSPPGTGLHLSLLLRPKSKSASIPPITLAVGVAVAEAMESFGASPKLKWPNDVYLDDKKIAGILTETSTQGERVGHVVVGVGVNLATESFPDDLADTATALQTSLGKVICREEFLTRLCETLECHLDSFETNGIAALIGPWESRAVFKPMQIDDGRTGTPLGLGESGALRIRLDTGQVAEISSGEVTIL